MYLVTFYECITCVHRLVFNIVLLLRGFIRFFLIHFDLKQISCLLITHIVMFIKTQIWKYLSSSKYNACCVFQILHKLYVLHLWFTVVREMSALNSGTESAPRSADNAHGASSRGPLHKVLPNASLQNASDRRPPQVIHAVIVIFDDAYLKTFPGIVRAVQLVSSF